MAHPQNTILSTSASPYQLLSTHSGIVDERSGLNVISRPMSGLVVNAKALAISFAFFRNCNRVIGRCCRIDHVEVGNPRRLFQNPWISLLISGHGVRAN
jgi:hypothetical protein